MRAFYPMMADLGGRRCVVVGGGRVAERRIAGLLEAEADIVVVSKDVTERIAGWEAAGRLTVLRRGYATGDLSGAFLVMAATDSPDVNQRVHADAAALGLWINVADRPELCNFIVPAVLRRGRLLAAVSTSGSSPAAASLLRDRIAQTLGEEIEPFLDFAAEYRELVKRKVPDPERRRRLLTELFTGDVLDRVQAGDWEALRERLLEKLEPRAKHTADVRDEAGTTRPAGRRNQD
jgi:precorrin-2 dehydrogenase/sirohydrochlorin ferrochelatase